MKIYVYILVRLSDFLMIWYHNAKLKKLLHLHSVTPSIPAAQPNGALIEEFDVTQQSSGSWEITMKPTNCRTDIGLIEVNGTAPVNDTATMKVYTPTSSATISIEQLQAASRPVGGTLKLSYDNIVVEGTYAL